MESELDNLPKEGESKKDVNEEQMLKKAKEYIQLNENETETEDVTAEFKETCSRMGKGQLISSADFKIVDTMNALEFNNFKMDPHYHNESTETFKTWIKKNKIKNIDELTLEETLVWIDEMFKREITWWFGGNLQESLFSLIYFSDDTENYLKEQEHSVFRTFLHTILSLIYVIYNKLNECTCYRDEDFCCIFIQNVKYFKEIKFEKEIKSIEEFLRNSKENDKKITQQILNRFHLQKYLLHLFFDQYENKSKEKYDNLIVDINSLKGDLNWLDFAVSSSIPRNKEIISSYINKDNYRIIPTISNYKPCAIFDNETTVEKLKFLLNKLTEVTTWYGLSNIFHIHYYIDNVINTKADSAPFIIRQIIDYNLFPDETTLFARENFSALITNFLTNIKYKYVDRENELIRNIINIQKDLLKRKWKNKQRQLREGREDIDNLTAVVIEGHKKESEVIESEKITKTTWTNYWLKTDLEEMWRWVHLNFELDMFKPYELDYVFYACENIVNQISMHTYVLSSKFADKILKDKDIASNNLKKKFAPSQKMLLDQVYIYNALKGVYSGLKQLMYGIKKNNLLRMPNNTEKETELKISKRFPYFVNCKFFMNINYTSFQEDISSELGDESFDDLWTRVGDKLKACVKFLKEWRSADQKLRDCFIYNDEYINNWIEALEKLKSIRD